MSQPWFKFYPASWQADQSLRMCSLEARGLWMEMLCIMHNAPRRGYLESPKGEPLNDDMLCRLIGTNKDDLYRAKSELVDFGVLSVDEKTGAIYSRRMVKDSEKAKKCAAAGANGGGNPALRSPLCTPLSGENKENIEVRSYISLKDTFKGQIPAATASMVEEVINCRPEFNGLNQEQILLAIHNASGNPLLMQNHAEFISDMVNSLKIPNVPVKLYAKYLSGVGKPEGRRENPIRPDAGASDPEKRRYTGEPRV